MRTAFFMGNGIQISTSYGYMRRFISLLVISFLPLFSSAKKIDYGFLKKINGTIWELQEVRKPGFFRKYNKQPSAEKITFSGDRILFDLPDANYYCTFRLQNKKELMLYCTEPDEYLYRLRILNAAELVMDVQVKQKDGSYRKWKRKVYRRVKR